MTRASPGQGTYYPYKRKGKPTGRWCGQITVHSQTFTTYGDTKAECMKACQAWAVLARKQPRRSSADVTLDQYLTHWLELIAPSVEPGTVTTYRWAMSKLPESMLSASLRTLSRRQVQTALSDLSLSLSASGVHLVRAALRKAMGDAVDHELIAANPCANLRIARGDTPEAIAWSLDDCQAFLAAADNHPWRAIWWILVATGLRNGESRALRWDDIDRRTGVIQVRRQWDEPARVESQPKRHRIRTVAVRGPTLHVLQEMPASIGYLVTNNQGRPVTGQALRTAFQQLIAAAGVPAMKGPHGLRHTAVTQMLRAGVPVHVVARMAGHSSPTITSKVYAHVLDGDVERAAESMAAAMSTRKQGTETA